MGERETQTDFERDCIKERGRILTGKFRHYCWEWDGMTMDETCPEFWDTCTCFTDRTPLPTKDQVNDR